MAVAKGAWGWGMRRLMMDYNHWSALGVLAELLPWEDNRVELAEHRDHRGLRVAKVTYALRDNDRAVIAAGVRQTEEILLAAGATEVAQEARYAHLVGGARMGSDPNTSVVDKFGGTHDVPNLFVCDGSILPTQGVGQSRTYDSSARSTDGGPSHRDGSRYFCRSPPRYARA